jgi:hypothetical protein
MGTGIVGAIQTLIDGVNGAVNGNGNAGTNATNNTYLQGLNQINQQEENDQLQLAAQNLQFNEVQEQAQQLATFAQKEENFGQQMQGAQDSITDKGLQNLK